MAVPSWSAFFVLASFRFDYGVHKMRPGRDQDRQTTEFIKQEGGEYEGMSLYTTGLYTTVLAHSSVL